MNKVFMLFGFVTAFNQVVAQKTSAIEFPKTYEFFPKFFPQAGIFKTKECFDGYINNVLVLEQFQTKAIFDFIPLVGNLFNSYKALELLGKGLSLEQVGTELNLGSGGSNGLFVIILADIKGGPEMRLEKATSPWQINLQCNSNQIKPVSIIHKKKDPLISQLLGDKKCRLKEVYLAKFDLSIKDLKNKENQFKIVVNNDYLIVQKNINFLF